MIIDDYDQLDEKPDVAIITPTESEETDAEPVADDCRLTLITSICLSLPFYRRGNEGTVPTAGNGS